MMIKWKILLCLVVCSRLVWAADARARDAAIDAISRAAPTLLGAAGRVDGETSLDWWRRAFALTYSAELRAERKERGQSVVDADRERYERFGRIDRKSVV